ncbi:helix-turn-helix domain-containing protein [Halegenticoccus soli]|uniref:helix-turn-helix domain-containing protein n=1 Tax=Halegenticoccus soli TaxID=1985678 RepID=UPI001E556F71|nr:bacterio-opsin activator domain-containing protein [Halegenticoccus soli]
MTGTISEIEIPADEFALQQTLAAIDDVAFEIERVVAHEPDRVMPFVWVSGADGDAIASALESDPSVENLQLLADLGDERLYRMDWVDKIQTLIRILVDEEGTILAASGSEDRWTLRALFPDRGALSQTHDFCRDAGISFDVRRVYHLDDGREGRFGLTEEQQEALTRAFEGGYYDVPRRRSLTELAGELGVSHQALSERLRRGHGNLIQNAIVIGDGAEGEKKRA